MIKVEENVSLKPYNTFGLDVTTRYLCRITSVEQLTELLQSAIFKNEKHYILGGGSNILFTSSFDGLIIKDEMEGIEVIQETDNHILVRVCAGENWHKFVMHCVANNWGGIENLSLIPGTVGAAPMQNIGAYGIEIKSLIENVEAVALASGVVRIFSNEECGFGYRESVFKRELVKKYFISSVTLRLTKKHHQLNTTYGAIQDTLKAMHVTQPTIKNVSDAVIHIRSSKLPDPVVTGNAGSFFKNPTVTMDAYKNIQNSHATIPGYPIDNQNVKVPAGWLIEQCGWKGKRIKNVGVHPSQALVLVHYGNGNGEEILNLAQKIQASVMEKFHIELTPEVNIL